MSVHPAAAHVMLRGSNSGCVVGFGPWIQGPENANMCTADVCGDPQ